MSSSPTAANVEVEWMASSGHPATSADDLDLDRTAPDWFSHRVIHRVGAVDHLKQLKLQREDQEGGGGGALDYGARLWEMLRKKAEEEQQEGGGGQRDQQIVLGGDGSSSWDLVIFQLVLLFLLVATALLWALCGKNRCFGGGAPGGISGELSTISSQVAALARKISSASSKDLPPSYSKVDLTTVGLSITDHLNPPPPYHKALEREGSNPHKVTYHHLSAPSSPQQQQQLTVINQLRPQRVSTTSSQLTWDETINAGNGGGNGSEETRSRVTFADVVAVDLVAGPKKQLSVGSLPVTVAPYVTAPQSILSNSEGNLNRPSRAGGSILRTRKMSVVEMGGRVCGSGGGVVRARKTSLAASHSLASSSSSSETMKINLVEAEEVQDDEGSSR